MPKMDVKCNKTFFFVMQSAVVKCKTGDRRVVRSSLTSGGVTVLCPRANTSSAA